MNVNIEKINEYINHYNDLVKVKTMGNHIEIGFNKNPNKEMVIKKLDKDRYMDLRTKEIKFYKKSESRADSYKQIKKSINNLMDIINTNVINRRYCKFITLTYSEKMIDTKKLYDDNKKFIQRLRYRNKDSFKSIEYITICEPQANGSWHSHIILIFDKKAPFIPNEYINELWGNGFTSIKNIKDIDNIGLYFMAIMEDLPQEEADKTDIDYAYEDIREVSYINNKEIDEPKSIVKGARLKLYPPGFRFYRLSKGIKKPIIEEMKYGDARKLVNNGVLVYSNIIKITSGNENKGFTNYIKKEKFNMNRKKFYYGMSYQELSLKRDEKFYNECTERQAKMGLVDEKFKEELGLVDIDF